MMKEQCWKQLTSQLCPKEKWVKDQDQLKCQHCTKEFMPLVRRRHHCRFCGNIFCSRCSDFFLNGKYLGLKEKFTRHCEFCHQKIEKFIKDCVKMPELYDDMTGSMRGSQNSDDEDQLEDDVKDQQLLQFDQEDPINNLYQMFGDNQKKLCSDKIKMMDEQIKQTIQNIAHILCDRFSLDNCLWNKKMSDIALKAAIQAKMDTFTSEGPYESSMDIVKQVKVKTIVTQPEIITAILLKGIVLDKNLPSKHMPTHLTKPKILLIENSIDIESFSSQMKFEDLLRNQKSIMKKILEKICRLSPDILFVQGNVNFQALEYLQQRKIYVVNKIKKKDLQTIMYMCNIRKTVRKLWMIERYKIHNIMGSCDKIYFKEIRESQSMMFIQADVGVRTIILGQATQELTNYLKRTMQLLLRFSRQLSLQKFLVSVDNQLFLTYPRSLRFPFFTQINMQVYQSPQSFGASQQVEFTKILFGNIKYNVAPKNFIQYGLKQGKSIFYQNCEGVQYERKKIYTTGDITLGGYLLLNVALNEKQCRRCELTHSERYYFTENVVVVNYLKKPNTVNVRSSFAQLELQDSEKILTLQRLKGALKKQKQKLIIETYMFCQICQAKISTQSIKVGKIYLQNSFYYFLQLLSSSWANFTNPKSQMASKQKLKAVNRSKLKKLSIEKCDHDSTTRVFDYSGCMMKFCVSSFIKYSILQIKVNSQEGKLIIEKNQIKFKQNLKEKQVKEKQTFFQDILAIVNAIPFPTNHNANFSVSFPSIKIAEKVQRFNRVIAILETLNSDFAKTKLTKMQDDWTLFLREIYKYQAILKSAYQIVEFFQNFLKKIKLDEKSQSNQYVVMSGATNEEMEKLEKMEQQNQKKAQIQQQNSENFNDSDTLSNHTRQHSQASMTMSNFTFLPGELVRSKKETETDSKSHPMIKNIRRQRFPVYQGHILKYSIGYTYDPVSVLACALNSVEFFAFTEQNAKTSHQSKDILNLKIQFSTKIKTSLLLKQQIQIIYKDIFEQQYQNKVETYEIAVFFPQEFQRLRVREGVDFQTYVKSLCGCKSWNSSGGKSNSTFAKSHNEILVVKIINNKEFVEFQKFAENYLNYIYKANREGKNSLLAKIYGIYEVSMRGKQYKCIVMENLFFGINNITKVYDLKGSEVNRLTMPQDEKSYTGQDTNFKIDKDNEPYILSPDQYNHTISVLEADAKFLKDQQVIDYSLLAIQSYSEGKHMLRLGIIDFMRPYHIFQKIENLYKKTKMGNDPTVIPPGQYSERFFAAMKKYFIKVS